MQRFIAATLTRSLSHSSHLLHSRSLPRSAQNSSSITRRSSILSTRHLSTPPTRQETHDATAVAKFADLGLPRPLARQLIAAFPHIHAPTLAQTALLDAITQPNDVILRAHTGTGKSFALLLALLAKPRVLFPHPTDSSEQPHNRHGIASIIVVPSNELAFQYYAWARALLPQTGSELNPIIQLLVRGHPTLSDQDQLDLLRNTPPHLIVATPTRLLEIISGKTNEGQSLLGLSTLRTLALDEADALLDLPGRFPTHKLKWRHTVHPSPSLVFLNEVMRLRPSCSGGQLLPSAGLERDEGRHFDERRPPDAIRRTAHLSREALLSKQQQASKQDSASHSFYSAFNFSLPKPRYGPTGSAPVQLVITSATANAVLRHFFGARTGWLRTGVKDQSGRPEGQTNAYARQERITGVWLDLTGLTKASTELTTSLDKDKKKQKADLADEYASTFPTGAEGSLSAKLKAEGRVLDGGDESAFPMTMPEELTHYCLVVDEPDPSSLEDGTSESSSLANALPPIRNLDPRAFIRPWRKALDLLHTTGQPDLATTIRSVSLPTHEVDPHLLSALAFAFASDASSRGLALVPAQWSLRKTKEMLEGMGVPVRLLDSGVEGEGEDGVVKDGEASSPVLYLLQATSARGLDLPVLTHVFIVGIEAVGDAVRYTHLAGRASRIGPNAELATIPQRDQDPDSGAKDKVQQTLRPLAKVITLIRGLPHVSLLRRRAALRAWSSLSKEDRVEQGTKKPQHDAIMVSSAERKLWTIWRRTGVSGRKSGSGGGMGKWDLRLVGGEAVEDEGALDGWMDELEEEEQGAGVEFEGDEEEEGDGFEDVGGEAANLSGSRETGDWKARISSRWEPVEGGGEGGDEGGHRSWEQRPSAPAARRERRDEGRSGDFRARSGPPRFERREDRDNRDRNSGAGGFGRERSAATPYRGRRDDDRQGDFKRRPSASSSSSQLERRDRAFRPPQRGGDRAEGRPDAGFKRSPARQWEDRRPDAGFKRSPARQWEERREGRSGAGYKRDDAAPRSFGREREGGMGRKPVDGNEDRLDFGSSDRGSGKGGGEGGGGGREGQWRGSQGNMGRKRSFR
ncbi:hypothetical protein A4X13_0g7880 [Tilletia indica]|uniref:RNA helicase n=1 Tax=Tilletia indica TaxID=43049 RepID=A0A177T4D9_9BASI|nr:hypothetical protein A4X13_0g7880 [Tilletia indica]